MKNMLRTLLALPMALFMAFASASISTPTTLHAEGAADAQFVDGNWFSIAAAKGEAYKAGSPTEEALQAQLSLYQTAVESGNVADAEKYAIRSWVKANFAAEQGLRAIEAGDFDSARTHLERALNYAKTAQKPGAGKGEQEDRVCDDSAAKWRGCSKIEGQRAEAYVKKLLKKLPKQ